jgi:hypothetical protein
MRDPEIGIAPQVMLCSPQKSSISCVSGRPPINDPTIATPLTFVSASTAPTMTIVPSRFSIPIYGSTSCPMGIVLSRKSKLFSAASHSGPFRFDEHIVDDPALRVIVHKIECFKAKAKTDNLPGIGRKVHVHLFETAAF